MPDKKEFKKFKQDIRDIAGKDAIVTEATMEEFSGADPEELKELGLI
jgi:hypothetical protein